MASASETNIAFDVTHSEPISSSEIQARSKGTITFESINYSIPKHYGLLPDTVYILTCFTSNIYIKTLVDDPTQFEVTDFYGDKIDILKEYLIIHPKH